MTIFQKRLEQALTLRNMTAAELARKTGIREGTISQYRTGYCRPRDDKLYLICQALDVSPAWILGFDNADEETVDKAINDLIPLLSDEQKAQVEDYIRFLIANRK